MPSCLAKPLPSAIWLALLDKAKAMGFDAIDIVPFDIERFPAKQVRQRAADLGLDIIIEIGTEGLGGRSGIKEGEG
jgi:sugar phosphate isomerase/epimerase